MIWPVDGRFSPIDPTLLANLLLIDHPSITFSKIGSSLTFVNVYHPLESLGVDNKVDFASLLESDTHRPSLLVETVIPLFDVNFNVE